MSDRGSSIVVHGGGILVNVVTSGPLPADIAATIATAIRQGESLAKAEAEVVQLRARVAQLEASQLATREQLTLKLGRLSDERMTGADKALLRGSFEPRDRATGAAAAYRHASLLVSGSVDA